MKTPKEILGRAVALSMVAERALLEEDGGDGLDSVEEQVNLWQFMNDWIKDKQYTDYMTEDEKRFMDAPVRQAGLNWAGPKSYLVECLCPLLWSIGLLDSVVPYAEENVEWYASILQQCDPNHDMEEILSRCKMRSREEIERQCNKAFLWHWRAVETRFGNRWSGDVRKAVHNTFRGAYDDCLEDFPLYKAGDKVDFLYNGHGAFELKGLSRYAYEGVALMRHHALEWILCDEDWDETPTDT